MRRFAGAGLGRVASNQNEESNPEWLSLLNPNPVGLVRWSHSEIGMKRAEQTPLEMVAPSRPRGRLPRASRGRRFGIWAVALLLPILAHRGVARASVALLMEEPYGDLGHSIRRGMRRCI